MASAVRNTFNATGTRDPSRLSAARAKAMSVATGTAQPRRAAGSARFSATYISAGTTIPPSAATPGAAARRTEFSSPSVISRRISSPTSRKNTAISPSLIQPCNGSVKLAPAALTPIGSWSSRA